VAVETPLTVSELVSRFELRRRAPTPVFAAGVRLARQGAVRFQVVNDFDVQATVEDDPLAKVQLRATAGRIHGGCSCVEPVDPCMHQVAVAHALWTRARRRTP
jgi:uncharacterized Zn finger protein